MGLNKIDEPMIDSDLLKKINGKTEGINVKEFGAVGDGVTDDTVAIENAITYASQKQAAGKKVKLLFPGDSQEYKSTRTIIVPSNIDVEMLAPIVYKGNANEPCLVIGETNVSTKGVYRLAVDRGTLSDWTNENCIGIVLINADTSDVHVELARNFTIGVQCLGSDGGWAYNTIRLGALNNNKIGLDLTSELDGWCNENLYIGGRFSVDSLVHIDKDRIGVRIWGKDQTYDFYNNNVFEKPSFEISSNPGLGVALPILIEDGFSNKFNSIRSEGDYPYTIITKNDARSNYVEVGYGIAEILNEGKRGNNYCYHYGQENLSVTYAFENLHKKANQYNATEIYVPGVAFEWGDDSQSMISGVSIQSDCLQFTSLRLMHVTVDTSVRKRFMIHRDVLPGFGGRIYIRCYDANGNILTEANGEEAWRYAKGSATFNFYTSTNSYETGADSEGPFEIYISEEVKMIDVIFTRGTNDLKIRGFSITSLDGAVNVYSPSPDKANGQGVATQIPTLGTYEVGRFLSNDDPTEITDENGSVYVVTGWTCTDVGTPGTWVENRAYTTIASQPNAAPTTIDKSVEHVFTDLHRKANHYDATNIYIPGFDFDWGGPQYQITSVSILADSIQIAGSRELRKYVDTSVHKRFVVSKDVLAGFGGRVYVYCYDAAGTALLYNGTINYLQNIDDGAAQSLVWFSGGYYETQTDSNAFVTFQLSTEVKKIQVIFTKGTAALKIRGFSIKSLDGYARVFNDLPELFDGQGMAIAIPTVGTYLKGRVLMNANPTELGTAGSKYIVTGWTCITAGTPGTWVQNRSLTGN